MIFAALIAGCSDRGTAPHLDEGNDNGNVGVPVSYSGDVQPIWNSNCVGCHGEGGNGNLDLRAPDSRGNLVGVAASGWNGHRVVAGEPDQSVLHLKLMGASGVGGLMPPTGSLGADDLETVRLWIAEGAQDN